MTNTSPKKGLEFLDLNGVICCVLGISSIGANLQTSPLHYVSRCAITGRARGIWHQFRVSRMVVRQEADYNRLSGVQRAKWLYNTHLDP